MILIIECISDRIITPPMIEENEKQKWLKDKEQYQRDVQQQQTLVGLRTILDMHQRQESLSNDNIIIQLHLDKEPQLYKKNSKNSFRKFLQRLLGEFIGTFILIFCCASLRVEFKMNRINSIENTLGQGLIITALIYSLGGLSGAHFNPVVTLVFTLRRVFPLAWLPFYNIVQLTASIAAGGVLHALYKDDAVYGTNSIDLTIVSSYPIGFVWEIILSFFLILVVLQTATRGSIIGPLAALAVGSINILNPIIGNVNSSSTNPVRTIGPSIINSSEDKKASLWIYIVGPYLGGLIAFIFVTLLNYGHGSKEDNNDEMEMAQGGNK